MTTPDPVTGQHRAEAWRVGDRFGWSCLDCTSKADDVIDATAAERGAEWHSLHPHGLTAAEHVTGATQDPRWSLIIEIVSPLLWSPHTDRAALAKEITDAIDAADAAAGIRRVPAEEAEAQPTVGESHGFYVVTFSDGSTSTWATNQSYLFDPSSIFQRRRNADALDAIARYRGGAS